MDWRTARISVGEDLDPELGLYASVSSSSNDNRASVSCEHNED